MRQIIANTKPDPPPPTTLPVFGLAEICAESIRLTDIPAFEKAWLQYCELYNTSREEQKAALRTGLGKLNLLQAHARLTAFATRRR